MKKLNRFGKGALKVAGACYTMNKSGKIAKAIVDAVPNPMGKVAATIGVNVMLAPVFIGSLYFANKGADDLFWGFEELKNKNKKES